MKRIETSSVAKLSARMESIDALYVFRILCLALVAGLVLYPLFWLFVGSFQKSPGSFIFSVEPYVNVLTADYLGGILSNTAIMTVGTTLAAIAIGVPMAWIVARTDTPMKGLVHLVALVPFITPPMVGAITWSYLGSPNTGFLNVAWMMLTGTEEPLFNIYSMGGLIWVMALYLTPYTFLFTSIALENMDPTLENAAYVTGSSPFETTLRVTLPLMAPAIMSGALLVFIQSLEIFAIPAAIGSPGGIYVFVTQIYQLLLGIPPKFGEAAALSIPLLFVAAFALWLQLRATGKGRSYATVGGKSFRPKLLELGKAKYLALGFVLFYLTMSAVLPYLVVIYGTFIKSSGLAPTLDNMTLEHLSRVIYGDATPLVTRSIKNSLILSIGGATIAIFLAAATAYFINRGKWRGQKTLDFVALIPIAIPGAVIAIGLLWAYARPPFDLYGTLSILLLAYVTRYLPFGIKAVATSIMQVSEELEKAAFISGADWLKTFRTILIPLLVPGLFAGWVLMFVSMMRELSASILLYAFHKETLAVALYLVWDEALFEYVSILSLIIVVLSLLSIAIVRSFVKSDSFGGPS